MNRFSATKDAATLSANFDAIDELPLPYIEMDAMGVITRANRATLALHPMEHGDLIGKMAWDLMATNEKEPSCAAYLSLMEPDPQQDPASRAQPEPVLRSLYTRSGEFRTYELHRSLIRDAEGRPAGMRMVCVDVTHARRVLEEAERARGWLESMMESVADAVVVTDALGFIRSINPAAEALVGWKQHDLIGKVIEKGLPLLKYESETGKPLSFTMALECHSRGIATILDRQRRELKVEITTSPIVDKSTGFTNGVLSVLRKV